MTGSILAGLLIGTMLVVWGAGTWWLFNWVIERFFSPHKENER